MFIEMEVREEVCEDLAGGVDVVEPCLACVSGCAGVGGEVVAVGGVPAGAWMLVCRGGGGLEKRRGGGGLYYSFVPNSLGSRWVGWEVVITFFGILLVSIGCGKVSLMLPGARKFGGEMVLLGLGHRYGYEARGFGCQCGNL